MSQLFSAVLLAGGKSSRMGRDKAFLEIDGTPLWRRQINTLTTLHPQQIFIAGPPRAEWIDAGCMIVVDAQENAGPLAGLVGALRVCSTPRLLTLAVDLPHLTADYLRRLVAASSDKKGAVPQSRAGFEPLAAVYPTAALGLAEDQLHAGKFALQDFVAACVARNFITAIPIRSDEESLFRNLNTPADLSAVAP